MPTNKKIDRLEGIYFITFTCYKWLPLFQIADGYHLVYDWFDYLKSIGHFINGYVIMPNHLHTLISFRNTEKPINTTIGNGKRFLAYDLVQMLKAKKSTNLLNLLSQGVKPTDTKRGKLHEVWEDSFDWKECRSREFILQKLNYMHSNPCVGKWNLAPSPVNYIHSSAKFYITGEQGIYPVTSYMDMEDVYLNKRQ